MIVTVTTDTCVSKLVDPALPDSIPVVPATTNCSSDIPDSNASSDAHDPSSGVNIYLSSDLHSTSTYDDGNGSTDDEFENIYVKRKKMDVNTHYVHTALLYKSNTSIIFNC